MKLALKCLAGVILFSLGVTFGQTYNQPDPIVRTKTETVTVHDEKEVPAPYVPESCLRVGAAANALANAAARIDDKSTKQLDIISEARKAIAMHNMNKLNELDVTQRHLQDQTLSPIQTIVEKQTLYAEALKQCKEDTSNGGSN